MGRNLNKANITLNSSTDFGFATSKFACCNPRSIIFSDFAILQHAILQHRIVQYPLFTIKALLQSYMQISTGVE